MRRDEMLVVQGRVVDVRWLGAAGRAEITLDLHAVWRVNPPESAPDWRDRLTREGSRLAIRASLEQALGLRVGRRVVALVEARDERWCLHAVDFELDRPPRSDPPRVAARVSTGY